MVEIGNSSIEILSLLTSAMDVTNLQAITSAAGQLCGREISVGFKAIILLRRKEDLTKEAFREWWLEQHRPLALQLPGLRKMVINISQEDDAAYDGASELWFDTRALFEAAYSTDLGKAVARDSLSMVSRRDRIFVEELEFLPEG